MTDAEKVAQNGQNGQSNGKSANGHQQNGASAHPKAAVASSGSKQKKPGVVGSLLSLRKASRRPLPTEMGDGSYRVVPHRPTLAQDLRSFGKDGKFNFL